MSTVAASAQTPVCRQLFAQAKEARSEAPSNRTIKRDLARTLAQADRRGCFGGFFFRGRGKGCGTLLSRVERLEQMLHRPKAPRKREWVARELARNGCHGRPQVDRPQSADASGGGYRTVCVRSCDGYFFPLGFSQSKGDFKRDREVCKGLYGDASAELYFYPSASSPDRMVSVEGESYAKQSFAFNYQKEFRASCQAELHHGVQRVRDSFLAAAQKDAFRRFTSIPMPVPRPTTETVAVDAGQSQPRKSVSRIIASFPVYLTAPTAGLSADAEAGTTPSKSTPVLSEILSFIAPPAKAESPLDDKVSRRQQAGSDN